MASPRLTRVELNAARTISASSIRVDAVVVTNTSGGNVEVVFRNNAATEILSIACPAAESFSFESSWIADAGLTIDSAGSAAVSVMVAHSQIGA